MSVDRDFRKLDPAVQAELRRRAVAMVDGGMTRLSAAEAVSVNRRFVTKWRRLVTRVAMQPLKAAGAGVVLASSFGCRKLKGRGSED